MPVPVVTVAEMRQWEEKSWDAGRSQDEVIERVGQLVAQRALELTRPDDRILILAGKGHNGDDARCAQAHLVDRKVALLRVRNPIDALEELAPFLARKPDLIVDGVFGIGLTRPLDEAWIRFIEAINQAEARVLAVDVPSGLNAETGKSAGAILRAAVTFTLGAPKRGLLAPGNQEFVGRLEVAPEIGLVPCPFKSDLQWVLAEDFEGFPPARPVNGHKGTFGHVAVIAGSVGYHGAAVLAARGAMRAQPGLVSVFCAEEVYLPIAAQLQAAMVHPWRPHEPLPESCSAVVIGPGLAAKNLSDSYVEFTRKLWVESPLPVIVDASALPWLPAGPVASSAVRVITPHPGEAARLLGKKTEEVQQDRVGALRWLAGKYGNCRVILKGHQSLVGGAEGVVSINSSGNPFLAQGGSGDVLAGYVAGLLAQRPVQEDIHRALTYAVWQHGATADQLSEERANWTIEELLQNLGTASC